MSYLNKKERDNGGTAGNKEKETNDIAFVWRLVWSVHSLVSLSYLKRRTFTTTSHASVRLMWLKNISYNVR